MTARSAPRAAQQRRLRSDARLRLLDAARELLESRRWHEVTLEAVAARAGLSRTAFYRHFADRQDLLLELVRSAGVHLDASGQGWLLAEGDPVPALHAALAELTEAMVEQGRLVRAIVDAGVEDADLRASYDDLLARLFGRTAARIEQEVAAGRSRVADPVGTAEALIRMNESLLLAGFGQRPFADAERVTAQMAAIWTSVIYGNLTM